MPYRTMKPPKKQERVIALPRLNTYGDFNTNLPTNAESAQNSLKNEKGTKVSREQRAEARAANRAAKISKRRRLVLDTGYTTSRIVTCLSGTSGKVGLSDDGGATWQVVDTGFLDHQGNCTYDPNNKRFTIAGGVSAATDNCWYSDDGGFNWNEITMPGPSASTDGGTSKQRMSVYEPVSGYTYIDGNRGQTANTYHYYSSNGKDFSTSTVLPSAGAFHSADICADGLGNIAGVGASFVPGGFEGMNSSDGGINVTRNEGPPGSALWDAICYVASTDKFHAMDASSERFATSTDKGATWTSAVIAGESWGSYVRGMFDDPFAPGEILALVLDQFGSGASEVMRSTDEGLTWTTDFALASGSFKAGFTYDEVHQILLCGGGFSGTTQQILGYDGTTWVQRSTPIFNSTNAPQGMGIAYDGGFDDVVATV